ncbi:MAG: helix-turn-helix domain-containing protein [Pseudomonadota bacterium]
MSSSDELGVSVDVISAGPTPGQQLRLAREKRGLSLDDVTTETNLSPKYLKALEEDDYASLPGLAFARGYARRYAQLVHLDGSALIAAMDVLAAAQGVAVSASLSPSGSSMQRAGTNMSQVDTRKSGDLPGNLTKTLASLQQINLTQILSVGSLALLVLLLLGTLFWQGSGDVSTEPMADNGVIDIDADVLQQVPAEAPVALPVEPVVAEPVAADAMLPAQDPALAATLPATDPAAIASPSAPAPAAASSAPAVSTAAPVAAAPAAAPVAQAPALAAKPAAVPATAVKPVAAPAVAPAVTVPAAKPATAAPAAPGIDSLNFNFSGKSWISVRDATGQELVYGLKNAGQAVTVTGQAPFSINIGNVNVTTLSRNGRGVNLKQYARGEIASFRLAPSAQPKP